MTSRQARVRSASELVRVEIPAELLLSLLEGYRVSAVDMRCLDAESRQRLRRLLLLACARNCRGLEGEGCARACPRRIGPGGHDSPRATAQYPAVPGTDAI